MTADSSASASPQQRKQPRYELTKEQKQMIKADSLNKKVWDGLLATIKTHGSVRFACTVWYMYISDNHIIAEAHSRKRGA